MRFDVATYNNVEVTSTSSRQLDISPWYFGSYNTANNKYKPLHHINPYPRNYTALYPANALNAVGYHRFYCSFTDSCREGVLNCTSAYSSCFLSGRQPHHTDVESVDGLGLSSKVPTGFIPRSRPSPFPPSNASPLLTWGLLPSSVRVSRIGSWVALSVPGFSGTIKGGVGNSNPQLLVPSPPRFQVRPLS